MFLILLSVMSLLTSKAPSHISSGPFRFVWNIHQALDISCVGSMGGWGYSHTCALLSKPRLIFLVCISTSWVIGTVVLLSAQSVVICYYWYVMLINSCAFWPDISLADSPLVRVTWIEYSSIISCYIVSKFCGTGTTSRQ